MASIRRSFASLTNSIVAKLALALVDQCFFADHFDFGRDAGVRFLRKERISDLPSRLKRKARAVPKW
jgi:hypothetical protein